MMKKLKNYFLKRLRLYFVKKENFFGDYATNMIDVKKFVADHPIIAVYFASDSLKVAVEFPKENAHVEVIDTLVKEQLRVQRREFRKEKKAVLYYVEDHVITRALGYKENRTHTLLSA